LWKAEGEKSCEKDRRKEEFRREEKRREEKRVENGRKLEEPNLK